MPVLAATILLTGLVVVVLLVISQMISHESAEAMFAETGRVERASEWLWLLLAATLLVLLRPWTMAVWGGVVLCLFGAAREADLHKELTGYSVLKPGFYLDSAYPLGQQLIAGAIVLLVLASAGVVCWRLVGKLRSMGRPIPAWVYGVVFTVGVLVGSKVLDRSPAILREDFSVEVPERVLSAGLALEEGLEAWLPMLILGVVLCYVYAARPVTGSRR